MIETRVIAYDYRCDMLVEAGIPFGTYWMGNVLFFVFPDDLSMREALDLINS